MIAPEFVISAEDRDSLPVTNFAQARRFIESRVGRTTFPRWCAIEDTIDVTSSDLSTVVRVTIDGRLDQVRAGAIPLDEIENERGLILQE